jgi:hypothetical protein
MLNMWRAGGLCANPQTNLVTNIGFGAAGTHCHAESSLSEIPTGSLGAIRHAETIRADARADRHTFTTVYHRSRQFNADRGESVAQAGFWHKLHKFLLRLRRVFGSLAKIKS